MMSATLPDAAAQPAPKAPVDGTDSHHLAVGADATRGHRGLTFLSPSFRLRHDAAVECSCGQLLCGSRKERDHRSCCPCFDTSACLYGHRSVFTRIKLLLPKRSGVFQSLHREPLFVTANGTTAGWQIHRPGWAATVGEASIVINQCKPVTSRGAGCWSVTIRSGKTCICHAGGITRRTTNCGVALAACASYSKVSAKQAVGVPPRVR